MKLSSRALFPLVPHRLLHLLQPPSIVARLLPLLVEEAEQAGLGVGVLLSDDDFELWAVAGDKLGQVVDGVEEGGVRGRGRGMGGGGVQRGRRHCQGRLEGERQRVG